MGWEKVKPYLPLIGIVIIALLLRFVYLGQIPNAISGDELHYVITAKSVVLTGRDVSGTWNPLSVFLFRYPAGENQAELPYFLHLLASGPFGFSLFWVKLPFALLSVGIVVLLYGIAKELLGKPVGVATGLAAAINPWLVVMGRTGYESTPATFFYLLTLYLILILRGWKILWTLIPLLLGFYSYIGTKLIFIPFTVLAVWLGYKHQKRRHLTQYLALFGFCLAFTALFVFLLQASGGSRMGELVLPSSVEIKTAVDEIRRTAIASPILPLLVNKYVVYVQMLASKLFRIFSPSYLFVEGDQFFLPGRQSFFYYVDFLFLAIGLLTLYGKKKFAFWILWLFILVGTFPHLFHKTTGDFSGHLALMFPFLVILIGCGMADVMEQTRTRFRPFILAVTTVLYIASFLSFSAVYFLQIPLVGQADFRMRPLSRYVYLAKKDKTPITIYSTAGGDLFTKYLFYANAMARATMPEISSINTKDAFQFQEIRFVSCDRNVHEIPPSSIFIVDQLCDMNVNGPNVSISRLSDGGQWYKIYGDRLCGTHQLTAYATGVKISDFNIEKLPEERFCQVYIHR